MVFWAMLLMHFLADYTLQGWLADGKQRSWWEKALGRKVEGTMYARDYVCALLCHSAYWSILVMLPLYWYGMVGDVAFTVCVTVNALVHMWIDDAKANRHAVNLWTDQGLHFAQMVVTLAAVAGLAK